MLERTATQIHSPKEFLAPSVPQALRDIGHTYYCGVSSLNKQKRNVIEGWLQKAFNQLYTAREHLKYACRQSEAIQAAQECIELSVKAILSILNIQYSKKHGWEVDKEEFEKIAKQINDRNILEKLSNENLSHIRLPRLIMLMNFWSQLYIYHLNMDIAQMI